MPRSPNYGAKPSNSTTGGARPVSDRPGFEPSPTGGSRPVSDRPDFAAPVASPPATPAPPPAPAPTDPRGFQQYLNDRGAKPPLKVDGIVGAKTLAAAKALNIPVPDALAPKAPAPATQQQPAGNAQQTSNSSQPAGDVTQPPVNLTADQIKAQYGAYGAILDFPDVAQLISQKAADPSMTDEQFLAALKATPTWQNHSTAELNFLALKADDQRTQIDQQKADLDNQAKTLGVTIAPDRLTQIATDSLKFGWDATQIKQAVAAEYHYQPGAQQGQLGVAEQSLKQMAHDYLVPVTDSTLGQWEAQIAAGTATPDTFKKYFVDQAAGLFPAIAQQLQGGATVQQLADPYRQLIAKELGSSPDAVDFTQPKWMRFLSSTDPKTGQPTMMGLADAQRTIRTDPTYGWDYTQNGQDAAYQFQRQFLSAVGKLPGA